MTQSNYMLGHSDSEIRRLIVQAQVIGPITARLLREAGIAPGMRVLDIGCGAGDVAQLAAGLVGPTGKVVGIDREPRVLEVARARASCAGLANIDFEAGDVAAGSGSFDIVIGRYVLLHQPDPARLIRRAATHARPGGVVAFHEVQCEGEPVSTPSVPLWDRVMSQIYRAFAAGVKHAAPGKRLVGHFQEAGLGVPNVFCEIPVGGGAQSPLYEWIVLTFLTVAPQLRAIGALDEDLAASASLIDQLRHAVVGSHAQVEAPHQHCGWAVV